MEEVLQRLLAVERESADIVSRAEKEANRIIAEARKEADQVREDLQHKVVEEAAQLV